MSEQVSRNGRGASRLAIAAGAALAGLSSLVLTSPLSAQVRQYTPPGGAADQGAGRQAAIEKAVEEARWHAGPLRLDPALWISDLSWVDRPAEDSSGSNSDLTARAGAGLRAYLPVGPKTTVAAYALPEYVWWKERAAERRVNQRFGLGTFTYFNRLTIAVTAQRDEDFNYATGEVLQRYTSRNEKLAADVEVPILRRLSLFAHGEDSSVRSLVDSAADPLLADFFDGLDRDDRAYRGGVRYYPSARLHVGAGVGHSESAFVSGALERSNAGDFWYIEAGYERPKLLVDLLFQENQLAATDASNFADFNSSTGGLRIEWKPREAFSARLYGARQLAYSLLVAEASGYVDERLGAGVNLALGWRLRLDLFGESGSHRYQAVAGAGNPGGDRVDDVASYGVTVAVELPWRMKLRVGYQESKITPASGSGLPGQKISQLLANLGFGFGQGTWY
ncbi:MAG: hypothetical protein ABI689_13595 [Thermoanaerobaculia bacterium]